MWLFKQIRQEPVLFQGLIQALFPVLVAFGVLQLQESQLATLYAFTAALLSFLTRTQVTPLSNPRNDSGNRLVSRPSSD
ncbi:MAG: hypothetical protein EAZ60_01060 [Oscillatoriales cyanobacterium]|uniref:hypothetical protein n=1 Tax=unclassified Microcoleus TaxID=2642155 RepID=UPI001D8528F5|nr:MULTISPECIES: hypothetical protein [unclassified Microcoleus]MCC3460304.1 hypothetical protein [Microcoleus sp. PH2017_11_PCY_U_A]TAE83156.1 MAG: hypothetical protein EAZ83_10000 [Oscillatoriales cyanobacterium]MCC3559772.1 hypothetical protein [Microcoleus sp. PH2017_27_LUM_O_A]TAE95952.1 MAG: hypothetical protein EAZ79_16230 [Oscillatoriales cyanobacterium]TAF19577.1 MAG: hypothetical protein EAZ73_14895 [Oscillatoriales cyanobacterium]